MHMMHMPVYVNQSAQHMFGLDWLHLSFLLKDEQHTVRQYEFVQGSLSIPHMRSACII